jgi:hypothetical protein
MLVSFVEAYVARFTASLHIFVILIKQNKIILWVIM